MMLALAPGSEACTLIVGKSTCGNGETGSRLNETMPAMASPQASSVVAIGRLMKGEDGFIAAPDYIARQREKLSVCKPVHFLRAVV
jgi:hypothetical protein